MDMPLFLSGCYCAWGWAGLVRCWAKFGFVLLLLTFSAPELEIIPVIKLSSNHSLYRGAKRNLFSDKHFDQSFINCRKNCIMMMHLHTGFLKIDCFDFITLTLTFIVTVLIHSQTTSLDLEKWVWGYKDGSSNRIVNQTLTPWLVDLY